MKLLLCCLLLSVLVGCTIGQELRPKEPIKYPANMIEFETPTGKVFVWSVTRNGRVCWFAKAWENVAISCP